MYSIETKIASKNGWLTPAEARAFYGKYSRSATTVHWWGLPGQTGNHDQTVNFLLGSADRGVSSANYVVSDSKITMLVHPDNVAFASTSGNPVSVSIEFQPTLGAEGYKKGGWLIRELEKRYGVDMHLYPHNYWNSTQCPGTISIDRLVQETNKWATGAYTPDPITPTPAPAPAPKPPVELTFKTIRPSTYICNKPTTNLFQIDKDTWAEIGVIKSFAKGDKIDIYGTVHNSVLNTEWYVTKYSFDHKLPNGFSKADLDVYVAPVPQPEPSIEPQVTDFENKTMYTGRGAKLVNIKDLSVVKEFPADTTLEISARATYGGREFYLTEYALANKTNQGFLIADLSETEPEPPVVVDPAKPEWETNLQDKDDTEYWLKEDTKLVDITTGKPAVVNGQETVLAKDSSFVSSALTVVGGKEYRITDYSFKKGIFNGVPIDKLTLTKPGQPDIKPIPVDPAPNVDPIMAKILAALEKILAFFGIK